MDDLGVCTVPCGDDEPGLKEYRVCSEEVGADEEGQREGKESEGAVLEP